MKNIFLIISVLTTFLIAEKWEYLICAMELQLPPKDVFDKLGFYVLSNNEEYSKYNNFIDYNDYYDQEIATWLRHNKNNGEGYFEVLTNSLNKMGNDRWEVFDVQGTCIT